MPYDEQALAQAIKEAMSIPIPDGEDAAMATVEEISAGIAAGITENPTATILENEERIQALEDDLAALRDQVGELQDFVDSLDQRISPIEEKVNKLDP